MRLRDLPNLITALRLLLIAPFLWLLLQERYLEALLLFMIAGFSDVIDGYLAKRYGWTSRLGGFLDPLADKLLLMGSVLVLGWQGDLPLWLVALVILRDLVIITGAISYHFLIGPFDAAPLLISKLNTLAQLALVVTIVFHKGMLALPGYLLAAAIYGTALTTLLSGVAYVWQWGRRAWRGGENNEHVAR